MNAAAPPEAGTDAPSQAGRRTAVATLTVCVVFTILASGLFALDRGFVQDELWLLNRVRASRSSVLEKLVLSGRARELAPQRLLTPAVFVLADLSGRPRETLQLVFVAAWLATGALAALVAWQVFGRRPIAAFLAGALTTCATGDRALNNLTAVQFFLSVAAYLAALAALLRWWRGGRRAWLIAALLSLWAGLFTYDSPAAAAVLTPLLLLALQRWRIDRRLAAASALWTAAVLPYLALLGRFATSPAAFGAQTMQPLAPAAHALRALGLFAANFTPWRWAGYSDRPETLTFPVALPGAWRAALAAAGVVALLAALRWLGGTGRRDDDPPAGGGVPVTLLLMALASNACFATLPRMDAPYRTQLASRVLVSLALAWLFDWALARARRWRPLVLAVLAVLVGFGLDAGLASQDHYLTLWRRHRRELASVVEQLPALRTGGQLVLQVPAGAPLLATTYPEVGSHWISFLHPGVPTLIWNGGTGRFACEPDQRGFVCRDASRGPAYATPARQWVLPFESTLLMTYATDTGRFVLHPRLERGWRWAAPERVPADAARWVVPRAPSREAEQLLFRRELLAAWFPAEDPGLFEPLFTVDDDALALDPAVAAPCGLRVVGGRQTAAIGCSRTVVTGTLWSAEPHGVRASARLRGVDGARGRWTLELKHAAGPSAASVALSQAPVVEIDLERGRNDFAFALELDGPAVARPPGMAVIAVRLERAGQ